MKLNQIKITGLFARKDLEVDISDNRLIVVGENGAGKSTILTILFYCLTGQLERLASIPFDSLSLSFSGKGDVIINRSDLTTNKTHLRQGRSTIQIEQFIPRTILQRLISQASFGDGALDYDELERISMRYGVPMGVLLESLREQRGFLTQERSGRTDKILEIKKKLTDIVDCRVLFLPTYRRIERELKNIFQGARLEQDIERYERMPKGQHGYVELVQFGMNDVDQMIESAMRSLDRDFRVGLNRITGTYLSRIIRSSMSDGANTLQRRS